MSLNEIPQLRAEFDDKGLLFTFDLDTLSLIDFWRSMMGDMERAYVGAPQLPLTLLAIQRDIDTRTRHALDAELILFDGREWVYNPSMIPTIPPFFNWSSSMSLDNKPLPDPQEAQKRDVQRERVAMNLLQWLNRSYHLEYEPEDDWSDTTRLEQAAYARGYNDCRAELMRVVADEILQEDESDDDSDDCCCNR